MMMDAATNDNKQTTTTKEDDEDHGAVVIDTGTLLTKAGFAIDDLPRCVFPTIAAAAATENYHQPNEEDLQGKSARINDPINTVAKVKNEVSFDLHNIKNVVPPLERGYITTQWESMERIWHHTFYNELRVTPDAQPVLLTEPPMNPKATRERMTQIMFDTFNVPSLYINVTAVLALYSSGRITGCVIDSGDGITRVVPIYEGYYLPHATIRIDIGGSDVTAYLERLLVEERGYSQLTTTATTDQFDSSPNMIYAIKEALCYVAEDFSSEMDKSNQELEKPFELPDGTTIMLGKERFQCTEILFQSNNNMVISSSRNIAEGEGEEKCHLAVEDCNIIQATYKSMEIASREIEIVGQLCANIILTGGNTLFPGFQERFTKDMKKVVSPRTYVDVIAPDTRKYDVWRGGSILASLSTCNNSMWLTKEEYRQHGAEFIHRKCY